MNLLRLFEFLPLLKFYFFRFRHQKSKLSIKTKKVHKYESNSRMKREKRSKFRCKEGKVLLHMVSFGKNGAIQKKDKWGTYGS